MKTIKLAPGLELHAEEAAAQRYSIFGKPGSGKSNCAALLVEGLLAAGEQVVILDPASIWWSLRVGRDGKAPAFDIAVMGGEHGDLPLVASGGALIADALAGSSTSAVIDLSDLTLGDQRRFVTDFFEAFFHAKKKHRSPVLVVLEEAHEFIPQNVQPGEARMFGAIKRVAKIGRNFGIGLAEIDHRPQEVNKAVVNLSEVLFTFQMLGAHERKAIAAWVNDNDPARAGLENELPSLPIGTAQVLSPGWLKVYGKFAFALKQTYDAGRTPGRGATPVRLKPIDIAALRASMASVEEEARESDPKALRAEVARLKRELESKRSPTMAPVATKTIVEAVAKVPEKMLDRLAGIADTIRAVVEDGKRINADAKAVKVPSARTAGDSPATESRYVAAPVRQVDGGDAGKLGATPRRMLVALAQSRTGQLTRRQLATLAVVAPTKSTFRAGAAAIKQAGFAEVVGDVFTITAAGRAEVPDVQPLVDRRAVVQMWMGELSGRAKDAFEIFATEHGPFTKATIAERINVDRGLSTFRSIMAELNLNGLVQRSGGALVVNPELAL